MCFCKNKNWRWKGLKTRHFSHAHVITSIDIQTQHTPTLTSTRHYLIPEVPQLPRKCLDEGGGLGQLLVEVFHFVLLWFSVIGWAKRHAAESLQEHLHVYIYIVYWYQVEQDIEWTQSALSNNALYINHQAFHRSPDINLAVTSSVMLSVDSVLTYGEGMHFWQLRRGKQTLKSYKGALVHSIFNCLNCTLCDWSLYSCVWCKISKPAVLHFGMHLHVS